MAVTDWDRVRTLALPYRPRFRPRLYLPSGRPLRCRWKSAMIRIAFAPSGGRAVNPVFDTEQRVDG